MEQDGGEVGTVLTRRGHFGSRGCPLYCRCVLNRTECLKNGHGMHAFFFPPVWHLRNHRPRLTELPDTRHFAPCLFAEPNLLQMTSNSLRCFSAPLLPIVPERLGSRRWEQRGGRSAAHNASKEKRKKMEKEEPCNLRHHAGSRRSLAGFQLH